MFIAANGLSYWAMVRHNNRKDVTKSKKISNAWNKYESNQNIIKEFLAENVNTYNRSKFNEVQKRGLIIVEAYLGFSDHIFHISSGIMKFKEPTDPVTYNKMQVIDVTK